MASLNFKGKSAVWNHHLSVPYHTIEKDSAKSLKGTSDSENLIIQGDNLLALKALLPQYQGKVDYIYIDPPYNTGNEGWVYSDNVSSPTIKDWVGKTVGKEGEDLTRHDKWLCMMTPRLKLLRDLLSENGVIFVSIDDNEIHHLRMLMDEVFGEENLVREVVWKNKYGPGAMTKTFGSVHEYILCYSKTLLSSVEAILTTEDAEQYTGRDSKYSTRGGFITQPLMTRSKDERPNLIYPIYYQGEEILPDSQWIWEKSRLEKAIANDDVVFRKTDGKWSVRFKQYLRDADGVVRKGKPISIFDGPFNQDGTWEIEEIFGNKKTFPNPKPSTLIKRLLSLEINGYEGKDALILDSFAGSGTTAHAVIDLNKEDGGNRKFILVEMEDYANKITAERVRLASKKFGYKTGFTYSNLGPAIDAETLLSGTLPSYKEFAKYVYYLATGKNHPKDSEIKETSFFVGKSNSESIYLVYEKNTESLKKLAITLDWAQKTHEKDGGKKIVYAPACYLDDEALEQYNIKFVSIPYNLFERNA